MFFRIRLADISFARHASCLGHVDGNLYLYMIITCVAINSVGQGHNSLLESNP